MESIGFEFEMREWGEGIRNVVLEEVEGMERKEEVEEEGEDLP